MYYIKYLDMFRAILCSSSGGQNFISTASGIVTLCERPFATLEGPFDKASREFVTVSGYLLIINANILKEIGKYHLVAINLIRAGPRHVGDPGRLIICFVLQTDML
jgi:hypothetical protein